MIRVNGIDYNAAVAYPVEKLVATIATDADFATIFANMSTATEVSIVNGGEVIATYACVFNGLEKLSGGYKVMFNRAPMTVAQVEALERTVSEQGAQITTQASTITQHTTAITSQGETIGEHTETLNSNATELDDILTAIVELGDLIAELLGDSTSEGGAE